MAEKKQGKRGKRPASPPAMRLRRSLEQKVQTLLNRQYPLEKYGGKAEQQRAFAKDSGVSWSTVQRALDPDRGKTLDIIADLAVGFGVPVELLISLRPLDETRPFPQEQTTPPQSPRPTSTQSPPKIG